MAYTYSDPYKDPYGPLWDHIPAWKKTSTRNLVKIIMGDENEEVFKRESMGVLGARRCDRESKEMMVPDKPMQGVWQAAMPPLLMLDNKPANPPIEFEERVYSNPSSPSHKKKYTTTSAFDPSSSSSSNEYNWQNDAMKMANDSCNRLLDIIDKQTSQIASMTKEHTQQTSQLIASYEAQLGRLHQELLMEKSSLSVARQVLERQGIEIDALRQTKNEQKMQIESLDLRLARATYSSDDDGKCVVCLDKESTHFVVACRHLVYCGDCVEGHDGSCPICRKTSIRTDYIYRV